VIALLVSLGTLWDLWRAHRPPRGLPVPQAGRVVTVPQGAAPPPPGAAAAAVSRKPLPAAPVDLNRASADDFRGLPGVGPVLARRIVEARRERGTFHRIEDLLAVRGIGPRLLERLRPHLTLGAGRAGALAGAHAFRTAHQPDSVQILLQSGTPAFR
jgi:competence protein ComEA